MGVGVGVGLRPPSCVCYLAVGWWVGGLVVQGVGENVLPSGEAESKHPPGGKLGMWKITSVSCWDACGVDVSGQKGDAWGD